MLAKGPKKSLLCCRRRRRCCLVYVRCRQPLPAHQAADCLLERKNTRGCCFSRRDKTFDTINVLLAFWEATSGKGGKNSRRRTWMRLLGTTNWMRKKKLLRTALCAQSGQSSALLTTTCLISLSKENIFSIASNVARGNSVHSTWNTLLNKDKSVRQCIWLMNRCSISLTLKM